VRLKWLTVEITLHITPNGIAAITLSIKNSCRFLDSNAGTAPINNVERDNMNISLLNARKTPVPNPFADY